MQTPTIEFNNAPGNGSVGSQPHYEDAAIFIERCYSVKFNARIKTQFPTLMCVTDENNHILSVAGISLCEAPFFSEHYLDESAETTLSQFHGESINRQHIVEIGNLAGIGDTRATYFLLHALWSHMVQCQYQFLLITCTQQLVRRFAKLPVQTIVRANPIRVPQSARWGTYYSTDPVVLTGRLSDYDFRFAQFSYQQHYSVSLLHREVTQ